jgi:hypothetical protein
MHSFFPEYSEIDKVWVYQSDKNLTEEEVGSIKNRLTEFFSQWKSHGENVKADYKILYNRFIILIADASDPLCGRAMDGSVRFIKETGEKMQINFLDRMKIAYFGNEEIKTFLISEMPVLFQKGILKDDTTIFNNSISTKKEFENNWQISLKNSWLKAKIPSEKTV